MKKEKLISYAGTASGGASIVSAHNVCHYTCLGLIALLGFLGITVAGMPLMFLAKYNTLFWSMGTGFLLFALLIRMKYSLCISRKLLLGNAGLVIAGIPFVPLWSYAQFFIWVLGGGMVMVSIILWLKEKYTCEQVKPYGKSTTG